MKRLFFCLLILVEFLTAQVQLEKYYIGALGVNQFKECFKKPGVDVGMRAGIQTVLKTNQSAIKFNFRLLIDKDSLEVYGLFVDRKLDNFTFSLGVKARPICFLNRPHPISWGNHFLPKSKSVIPTSAPMFLAEYVTQSYGVYLGNYFINKDKFEYNYGLVKKDIWFLKEISLSGYIGNYKNYKSQTSSGSVINIKADKMEIMGFYANNLLDKGTTKSFLTGYGFLPQTTLYLSILNEDNKWKQVELGVIKIFSEQLKYMKVNYLFGAGYYYSEEQLNSLNFYFQIWLD